MTPEHDEQLAYLIDRLAGEQRAGRVADIDAVAREHPDLAAELRELWAVAQFAHLATEADPARFRTEAESAAKLKHPNIVTVYEVGTASGQAYICMEFVGGQTLAEKIRMDGPLPPREAARLVAVIARAVEHAHT